MAAKTREKNGDVWETFHNSILLLSYLVIIIIFLLLSFLWHMNVSTADLRNYWTEFHEIWWSYRYMFLVGPKVFSFVVKAVKVIF